MLLSPVGAAGYVALVDAAHDSQALILEQRLDELAERIEGGDGQLTTSLRADATLRVIRVGETIPEEPPGTLSVVRSHPSDEIEALVGLVPTGRIDSTFDTIRTALWISIAAIGVLVGLIAWVVVDRSLAPVRRLTRQAEANMSSKSLEPLPVTREGDELSELATTFNSMLARLRSADVERRRFVSDASHELRTPLMVLSADAEFALDHPTPATQPKTTELATSVLRQSSRLTELVDDLLTLAALDESEAQLGTADRHDPGPVRPVGEVLAAADATALAPHLPESVASAVIPDVSRSIANLVANARRHRTSRHTLDVVADRDAVIVIVDDDGPGVPESEREEIFKRFYRPDDGRVRPDGGAGLGLAIVKAEVAEVGGAVSVGDSPLGGARFIVEVPVVSS